jgi:hypothetical protein
LAGCGGEVLPVEKPLLNSGSLLGWPAGWLGWLCWLGWLGHHISSIFMTFHGPQMIS